eukprot:7703357-Alexandrium_andersonii.AAC.1
MVLKFRTLRYDDGASIQVQIKTRAYYLAKMSPTSSYSGSMTFSWKRSDPAQAWADVKAAAGVA